MALPSYDLWVLPSAGTSSTLTTVLPESASIRAPESNSLLQPFPVSLWRSLINTHCDLGIIPDI